jgi:hypothetical protein
MTSIIKVNNIQNSSGTSALSIDGSGRVSSPQGLGMNHLLTDTISSATSEYDINSTYINSDYDSYEIEFVLRCASDNKHLYTRVFVGGTIQTGSIYNWTISSQGDSSNDADGASQTAFRMQRFSQGDEAGAHIGGRVRLQNVNSTSLPYFHTGMSVCYRYSAATYCASSFSGGLALANRADVVNGIRFYYDTADIESGTIKVFGIK